MRNNAAGIFYSSFHNYLDRSSGAAISARAVLLELARSGRRVRALCGSYFDAGERSFDDYLSELKALGFRPTVFTNRLKNSQTSISFRVIRFNDGGIESDVIWFSDVSCVPNRSDASREESEVFLYCYMQEYKERRPDVFMTYGGFRTSEIGASFFKKRGVKTVFYLCNLAYRRRWLFDSFDAVVVPSEFAANEYKKRLGINAVVIPPLIELENVVTETKERRYLTYIAPTPEKGTVFFADLVRELSRVRPDIPYLIVQGRSSFQTLAASLGRVPNAKIKVLRGLVAPNEYYRRTRVLLVPSLCEESFGRVVIEAGANGIPSIVSTRGALPDTLGKGGYALSIPPRFYSTYNGRATPQELQPWLDAIVRFWDDESHYQEYQTLARQNSERFSERTIAVKTIEFFNSLTS